jgi:hypothetical protein
VTLLKIQQTEQNIFRLGLCRGKTWSFILRGYKLQVFENKVLRKVFAYEK